MLTLTEHAAMTIDMVPHVAQLHRLAIGKGRLAEFGVRTGVSTWVLLDALAPDGTLHSWDIVEPHVPERVSEDPRWRLTIADSLTADLPGTVELVMIDSSHEYHRTIAELAIAARWEAGTIVLHDWNEADVRDAVTGFLARDRRYRLEGIQPSQWGMAWLCRS